MHSYNTTQYSYIATTYNIANYIQHNINNNYTTTQYVTGPAIMDQVGTNYTSSYKLLYLGFCTIYLCSVSFKMLHIKLCIDGRKIMSFP